MQMWHKTKTKCMSLFVKYKENKSDIAATGYCERLYGDMVGAFSGYLVDLFAKTLGLQVQAIVDETLIFNLSLQRINRKAPSADCTKGRCDAGFIATPRFSDRIWYQQIDGPS